MKRVPHFQIPRETWIIGKKLLGKNLAAAVREEIRKRAEKLSQKPGLVTILVGEDPASMVYVASKEKAGRAAGFDARVDRLPNSISETELLQKIQHYNEDSSVHGILVQLPLPSHMNSARVLQAIAVEKDADGFHHENMGRLLAGEDAVIACTPLGVMVMLRELGVDITGMHAVVLGRSNIVGKPMSVLLLEEGQCTVTTCHSRTRNLREHVSQADILVAAMGKRGVVDPAWIKEGAIVIDVGMHRTDEGLTGDLDLAAMESKVSFYTPVPGGVGPMTIAMLLYNTLQNAEKIQGVS